MLPIIVTSCYTTQSISLENDFNKTYIGTNRAEIKSIFGNPDRVVNDKDTGEILIYEYFTTETGSCASAKSHSSRDSVYGDTTSYTNRNYVEFYFDQDRCYKVNTNERENVRKLNKGKNSGLCNNSYCSTNSSNKCISSKIHIVLLAPLLLGSTKHFCW